MAEAKNNQTPDVSEQDKIRRGKLADLQAAGNDPFLITKYNVPITAWRLRTILMNLKVRK